MTKKRTVDEVRAWLRAHHAGWPYRLVVPARTLKAKLYPTLPSQDSEG